MNGALNLKENKECTVIRRMTQAWSKSFDPSPPSIEIFGAQGVKTFFVGQSKTWLK